MQPFIITRQTNLVKRPESCVHRAHQEAITKKLLLWTRKTCTEIGRIFNWRKVAHRKTKNGALKSAPRASKEAVYTLMVA